MTYRQAFFGDAAARAAYRDLMGVVFDLDPGESARSAPEWVPFGFFDDEGSCVASVETTVLSMICDEAATTASALRLVAVHPGRRGQGLFRALMEHALAWCGTWSPGPCLLYTADAGIYRRFGFEPLEQHAFVGDAAPAEGEAGRPIDLEQADDRALLDRLLATRTAVSNHCAVIAAPSLFLAHVRGAEDLQLTYLPKHDALIVHEADDDHVIIVDVVAARPPPLATILGALGQTRRAKTLFAPDRLAWSADQVPEETGLMRRGSLPPAMARPFMLPPTTEF